MEKSESIKNLAIALVQFHGLVKKVAKEATNPFFKSKYASLPNILDAIREPLETCSLVVSQFPTGQHGLTTILIHSTSGEYMLDTYTMKPTKDDPQGIGSSITYQRRYALGAILNLNIDDDDDGNEASKPVKKAEQVKAKPSSNKPPLTDVLLKKAIERIKKGEVEVKERMQESFTMSEDQKKQLISA